MKRASLKLAALISAMTPRAYGIAVVIATLLLPIHEASAAIIPYSGSDDGASIAGPFPNSAAAAASFASAASGIGATSTITFESLPTGYSSSFTAAPGVSVALTGPNFGPGFSGISNSTIGNLYGFNITPGGSKWLGFPGGTATFTFANPTQSFGFFLTGVQTYFTSAITITFNDGAPQTLFAPVNVNGGASFFGFTDPGGSITSITISNFSTGNGTDAWGIDDVTFNSSGGIVPEPTSLAVFGVATLAGAAYCGWRRRKQPAQA